MNPKILLQFIFINYCCLFCYSSYSQTFPTRINLNGQWIFEQTENAFPPEKFTGKCPVPGLIHLAEPRIEAYDKLFQKPEKVQDGGAYDYRKLDYNPRYSWYKKIIEIPASLEGSEAMLTLLKSKYVTQVYVNGMDVGQSVSCYTPIDLKVTQAIKYGGLNEILIRVGERIWLPPNAAGGTDKEKVHYIPGIWDDVFLSFSGKQRIAKELIFPYVKEKKITVKLLIRSFYPQQVLNGDPEKDSVIAEIIIKEKDSGKIIAESSLKGISQRDKNSKLEIDIPMDQFKLWSPESPFLYQADIRLFDVGKLSDSVSAFFGMRDFTRIGKFFYLNGEKYYLRGSNITLHRFFEDPDCNALPWDRKWVKKMFIDDPKSFHWNAMRICVGLVPDFWYDLADEYGLLLQNEWLYWQNHGWDEQIKKEYTDWVWSDGSHPSIAIWDAINENHNNFIGNILIPELQELDPTRIWDAGFMQAKDLKGVDPIDEPHLYRAGYILRLQDNPLAYLKTNPYLLGKMDDWDERHLKYLNASATQLVNEYGWNWLWRDGRPAKLTVKMYNSLLGKNATAEERREFQAYWQACETEWIRGERTMAGVLAFCHLTNNYGFTGDWYIGDIKKLKAGPTLSWYTHAFAPTNVFIDLADQRYFPNGYYQPGELLAFNLVGINDLNKQVKGNVTAKIIDFKGNIVNKYTCNVILPAFRRVNIPAFIELPEQTGGYLILSEFKSDRNQQILKSRRYINIGDDSINSYREEKP